MATKAVKPKKCRACKAAFMPVRPLQVACSPLCGLDLARSKREKAEAQAKKAERAADKVKRERLKTIPQLLSEAQEIFNRWIRTRDEQLPCISCGIHPPRESYQGGRDAGHFRSRGAASHLRFHEDNCHAQCVYCNQHRSGNLIAYRAGLVQRIGVDRVEALEQMNEPHKWTREEAFAIKEEYAARLKQMKRDQA